MKKNKLIASVLSAAFLITPLSAFAQTTTVTTANFCVDTTKIGTKLTETLSKKEITLQKNRITNLEKTAVKQAAIDQARATTRDAWDKVRDLTYKSLSTKATSDAQKTAVATYKATLESAVVTRKASVDTAVKTFRDSVATIVADHGKSIDMALDTLKSDVEAAATTAKADCAAGKDPKTVKSAFETAVKSARTTFKSVTTSTTPIKVSIDALVKTRAAAIESAHTTFKTTKDQAVKDLKAAF